MAKPAPQQPTKKQAASNVRRCGLCTHEFQDATYGTNMRVMTTGKDGARRCTVCSKEFR